MFSLTNGKLIESASELPDFTNAKRLYLDVETKNVCKIPKYGGLYPFKGDRIAGFAFTVDDNPDVYYVPMRHNRTKHLNNIPLDACRKWLQDHLDAIPEWINHHVVFDATFVAMEGVKITNDIVCTLTLSKVHDSDRFGHGLKDLCREWLGIPMSEEKEVKQFLKDIDSKDWADVPIDILGGYACMDVIGNRKLYEFLLEKRHPDLKGIWETEIKLSSVLFDMEMEGQCINELECKIELAKSLPIMINSAEQIEKIADREFVDSSTCLYDILINQCGLPAVSTIIEKVDGKWVDTGRPSFDKEALALYAIHPLVTQSEKLTKLINAITNFRTESNFKSLFLDVFLKLNNNGRIHPTYNQVVRTGRMSCSRPNAQQNSKRSKQLIHPLPGYGFISNDYSQIEFRLIVHYINDLAAINAYVKDPNTDFHAWVASMLSEMQVDRAAAKCINFGMAYGAGEKKVTKQLSADSNVIKECSAIINDRNIPDSEKNQAFSAMCIIRAKEIYHCYHERFPGIKATSKLAMQVCMSRGYVFNGYGRRRHLPAKLAYRAFNSIIQGFASDIMKERMIALSPWFNKESKDMGLIMVANVHDEILTQVPLEILEDPKVHDYICDILQSPAVKLKVPIITGLGISKISWAEASGEEGKIR